MVDLPFADDKVLLDLAMYWERKRGQRAIPERAQIDPLEMPRHVLPHLALLEPMEDGETFRFRLAGTEIVARFGAELTGRTTAQAMSGAYRGYVESLLRMAVRERAPVYSESSFLWDPGGVMHTRRLALPVCVSRGRLQLMLGRTWQGYSGGSEVEPQVIEMAACNKSTPRVVDLGRLFGPLAPRPAPSA